MATVDRLYEVSSELSPSALAELIDFAEFLRERKAPLALAGQHVPLLDLAGGLEDSSTFTGSPLALQEKMRHEWD